MTKEILLLNPPIIDTQYWAHWSQPYGLLKVARWLENDFGYRVQLLDSLETNEKRKVNKRKYPYNFNISINKQTWLFGLEPAEISSILLDTYLGYQPDEVWITSIMTYWNPSTKLLVDLITDIFPQVPIRLGGIYPTLAPEHAVNLLPEPRNIVSGRHLAQLMKTDNPLMKSNLVVTGEVPEASQLSPYLELYVDQERNLNPLSDNKLKYAIVTSSRGCPYSCSYCAQQALTNWENRWTRPAKQVVDEIERWHVEFGVREFAFYEDNMLIFKSSFKQIMREVIARNLKISFYAPEGVEPRLIDEEVLQLMKAAGFKKVHYALETIDVQSRLKWNRKHANIEQFENAVELAVDAGFRLRNQDVNAFVLFGVPGEDVQNVVNTAVYASNVVGSVVPMLFTPVPGSSLYRELQPYIDNQGWDLADLNGKFHPFAEYNHMSSRDYDDLEGLMFSLNKKVMGESFNFFDAKYESSQIFLKQIMQIR